VGDTPSRAEHEFRNWALSLPAQELSVHEKKLLNLLLTNFSVLAKLGTASGFRAKKIRDLIYQQRETVNADYDAKLLPGAIESGPPTKILSLEIPGPFRGFSGAERFAFEKDCTIAYGPNGSGKSCFFEALELALLGEIEEATAKRIGIDEYIANVHSKKSSRPALILSPGQRRTRSAR
jgi:hypothetical protein